MQIKLDEIRAAVSILIDHIQSRHGPTVDVAKDFYWHLQTTELYDVYKEPTDLTIGQISENAAEIREIVSGERSPLTHGLVWVAAVLRAVSDSVGD